MTTETPEKPKPKSLKRLRITVEQESEARKAGLKIAQDQRSGFDCECGTHHHFSQWVMAHWSEMTEHKCPACGRVHKMKAGVLTLKSGPTKKLQRPRAPAEKVDPNTPRWRAYQLLTEPGAPARYRAVTDYHPTDDGCNNQAYDHALKVYPHSREKAEGCYYNLIRAQEFPYQSSIISQGLYIGGGEVVAVGMRRDELDGEMRHYFRLRTPDKKEVEVNLTKEVIGELLKEWEIKS
jgi:hypothetical protein